ncbi:unnamed protein product [Gemmata massiliana]|uniref:Uncharacterized protein n=1 Tax=Gemmata massiliana TaxID=1210884 RepID=A0A6P2CU72_9BACT|nr:unnamed protein product [Gemmata massiliana]
MLRGGNSADVLRLPQTSKCGNYGKWGDLAIN